MATLRMAFAIPYKATAAAAAEFEKATPFAKEMLNAVAQELVAVSGGRRSQSSGQTQPSLKVSIDESCTAATGTVTCASVSAADTVTVGGITFTAVNGGTPTSTQFDMSGTDTATATSLKNAINAHATTSQYVVATSAVGVVTVTAIGPALGVLGNAIKLTSSNGTRLAVVVMASGANDSSQKTYSF